MGATVVALMALGLCMVVALADSAAGWAAQSILDVVALEPTLPLGYAFFVGLAGALGYAVGCAIESVRARRRGGRT